MRRRGVIVAADHRPRRLSVLRAAHRPCGRRGARRANRRDASAAVRGGVRRRAAGRPVLRARHPARDPDVKWSRQAAHLAAFAAAQRDMLAAVASVVRPGGRLVYSTCSSEPEENEQVVSRFSGRLERFRRRRVPTVPGPAVRRRRAARGRPRVTSNLPFRDRLDAFYAALLVRRQQQPFSKMPLATPKAVHHARSLRDQPADGHIQLETRFWARARCSS